MTEILVYGRYTQKEWDSLTPDERLLAQFEYRMKAWIKQSLAAYKFQPGGANYCWPRRRQ
jgi:hypothetical protein